MREIVLIALLTHYFVQVSRTSYARNLHLSVLEGFMSQSVSAASRYHGCASASHSGLLTALPRARHDNIQSLENVLVRVRGCEIILSGPVQLFCLALPGCSLARFANFFLSPVLTTDPGQRANSISEKCP